MNKAKYLAFAIVCMILTVPVIFIGARQNHNVLLVGLLCGLLSYAITALVGSVREGFAFPLNEKISTLGGFLAIVVANEINGAAPIGTLAAGFTSASVCFWLCLAAQPVAKGKSDPS